VTGWPKRSGRAAATETVPDRHGAVTTTIDDLPAGVVALAGQRARPGFFRDPAESLPLSALAGRGICSLPQPSRCTLINSGGSVEPAPGGVTFQDVTTHGVIGPPRRPHMMACLLESGPFFSACPNSLRSNKGRLESEKGAGFEAPPRSANKAGQSLTDWVSCYSRTKKP
jgi:hypothetical protein